MKSFLVGLLSKVRALLRLALFAVIFILDGINEIVFNNVEVVDYTFIVDHLKVDRENVSYIDKLNSKIDDYGIDSNDYEEGEDEY